MLTPVECGHTFCGQCTLKWFFSRLHRGCGTWHESVDCPLCRALLIITPDVPPRLTITIPFAPNRLADATLRGLLDKLASIQPRRERDVKCTTPVVAKYESDPLVCFNRAQSCGIKVENVSVPPPENTGWRAWTEGGALRADWLERDR